MAAPSTTVHRNSITCHNPSAPRIPMLRALRPYSRSVNSLSSPRLIFPTANSPRSPHVRNEMSNYRFPRFLASETSSRNLLPPIRPSLPAGEFGLRFISNSAVGSYRGVENTQNQDEFFALGNEGRWILGVCDGHGPNGQLVAAFLKDTLPGILLDYIPQQKQADSSALRTALTQAHGICGHQLKDSGIDISTSGSTCVIVLVANHTIACANVGDSRAVLGRKTHRMWSVFQLSWDHKPDDPPEHSRIIAAGGEITPSKLTHSDSPRVYVKGESFPGLAMSRSMGDSVASTVGVISDPDIVTAAVNSTDKFLILASDGLWSVISSVEAVHKVGALIDVGKEDSACSVLIHEAKARWLKQGVRVDDITVVIAFFNP